MHMYESNEVPARNSVAEVSDTKRKNSLMSLWSAEPSETPALCTHLCSSSSSKSFSLMKALGFCSVVWFLQGKKIWALRALLWVKNLYYKMFLGPETKIAWCNDTAPKLVADLLCNLFLPYWSSARDLTEK